jgi:hypothetical protein
MADNIQIVGDILDIQQVSRYNEEDARLLTASTLIEDFGQTNDYIEYFIYDISGNLLRINYNYKDFKSPNTSFVTPTGSLPIIEIDPVKDLQNLGYTSGEFNVQYNFFNNRVSNPSAELFLKEISADRTELRIGSTILTNEQIESGSIALINEYTGSAYFVNYLVNFGDNYQALTVNVALNKVESGYEILFKLYEPLPINIQEKSSLWIVEEKINPYSFNINLDRLVIPAPLPQLRGPNFDIDISNQNNVATSYQTYAGLINDVNSISTSSYQQLLSLITSQSIDINVDYTDYNDFIFFSSAKTRLINFYNKIKDIEDYNSLIATYTPNVSTTSSLALEITSSKNAINNIISQFDGYEYYLYFESSSYTWPKNNSTLPYTLASTSSANNWYTSATASAETYDDNNQNFIINTLPTFIKDDSNNAPYLTFIEMMGHYFDNIWIFLKSVTDINLANNNLEKGVSKDLVYYVLQSLGTKLYNQYGDSDNANFLIGQSGSAYYTGSDAQAFTSTGSYLNTIPRKDLLAESYKRIYHNLPLLLKTKGTTYGLQTLISTFGVTGSVLGIKEYGGDIKSGLLDEFNNDKVRVISNNITGSVLSPFISLQTYPTSSTQFRTNDLHYVDISFSPQEKIDIFASASIAASASATWSLDDFIGDPRAQYSGSYPTLEVERQTYYSPLTASIVPFSSSVGIEYINATDYNSFIRLIQFFDNSLFKMLQDFVPARVNLSTGVTIASPVLERNKWSYANPSSTSEINVNEGTIDGIEISTEYTNLYSKLSGSKAAYYDGNITGSYINVYKYFESSSINPYLIGSTGSWNAQHTITESANLNKFLHSDFNVLLNNVSSSLTSSIRQDIQYVFGTTQSILSPAELQDSYESLITHQLSRYEGVKLSSLTYNTYTSASSTYNGDISFGKTAAIDHNSRKLGLFTDVVSSSYLPGRNNVRLLYLVDEFGSLTELNLRNKHWQEVQNTFIQGTTLDVSQFDNQKFSNQKTTDGTKDIFDSGYTYSPILYFPTCSANDKIYFQFNGSSNSYLSLANTSGTGSKTINGFSTNNYPLSASEVYNIFDSVTLGGNYLKQGTLSLYPTYSVQEGGNHKVSGSLTMTVVIPEGGTSTWNLGVYKNGISTGVSSTQVFDIGSASTASLYPYTSSQSFAITSGFSNQTEVYVQEVFSNKWIRLGGNDYPPNTPFYRYYIALYSNYTIGGGGYCNLPVEYYLGNDWYSLNNLDRYTGDRDIISCDNLYSYNFLSSFWSIPDFNTPTGPQTKTFNIDSSTINADKNDILSIRFKNTVSSSNNFTASFDNIGSLFISSLSVSTGYADTSCPYFNSASMAISSSITGSDSVIIFDDALSSFYGDGYTFVPNPLTGSINTLYGTYGDVDYPFLIKPQDILIVYLSDGTYVESRILEVTGGGTSSLRIKLDAPLSTLLRSDLTVGSGAYRSFLILSRIEDETSAYLTFKKRDGKTSYGFIIPNDIAPDILNNIDIITKEVKQKLINEQSAIDSISGGTFG